MLSVCFMCVCMYVRMYVCMLIEASLYTSGGRGKLGIWNGRTGLMCWHGCSPVDETLGSSLRFWMEPMTSEVACRSSVKTDKKRKHTGSLF